MGLSGVSIWQLLIILLIVAVIFGSKKLRHLGEDLGVAVSAFKRGLNSEADESSNNKNNAADSSDNKTDKS